VSLRDYVLIVVRGWIIVVVTVAVALVTAAGVALTTARTYTASADVLFTGRTSTSGQDQAYLGSYVQARMETYKNLGTSTSLMEAVAAEIGTDETPRELTDRVEIRVRQINTVATVSASDNTAKGAARTANTLANALLVAVQDLEAGTHESGAGEDEQPPSSTIEGAVTGTAEVPTSASDPNISLYLAVGAIVGLVISFGVLAVAEVMRGGASTRPPTDDP
jgi:capsular polysaccharide biosynthesis protein